MKASFSAATAEEQVAVSRDIECVARPDFYKNKIILTCVSITSNLVIKALNSLAAQNHEM